MVLLLRIEDAIQGNTNAGKYFKGLKYGQVVPLLGICHKELNTGTQIDICILMFMATAFITAKRRNLSVNR